LDPENINGVKDSTPVLRTCTIENVAGQDQLRKDCGAFTVNGLTTRERGVGLQIACLTDVRGYGYASGTSVTITDILWGVLQEATCLKDSNAADECKKKRQTCEFENSTGKDFTRLNQDGSSVGIDFVHTNDPVCDAEDKPLICTRRIADAGSGGLILEPLNEPSKFIEDNDTGATLIGDKIKKGPIGEGLKTTVQDNGDSTFTAGNLTTFSRNFAIQLGCLFDVRAITYLSILQLRVLLQHLFPFFFLTKEISS
jgi:hypothetical protein